MQITGALIDPCMIILFYLPSTCIPKRTRSYDSFEKCLFVSETGSYKE